MNLIQYFRSKRSAGVAKDRLHIIIAQQRSESTHPDYLPLLRKEILDVIAKYTHADMSKINIELHSKDNNSILELNVVLPEEATSH